ncbi:transcriptional regulator [Staphylococcus casei]|uniref:RrF2 family transcriptional regulator n=1 Tax=Staphylococcus TaxID=1279 RepID=UPI000CD08736|nr:Rrf2 family transcriptional regulator [Staphylococcus casei]PNZ60272.1 transcriptional regulator [Staphylococcus casei]PTI80221.1 Rrf2 family transcriptional regulator [Staphylococcus succinus]WJE85391.1 Rrf2 family transcriptional regulator [Staphylococcus casei]
MKFSKATDYALHALLYMIKSDGGASRIPVQDLASALSVSTTYLSKILTRLVKANIISAHSGAKGGYQLKKDWQNVSFYEVIVTIEGQQSLLEDSFSHDKDCPIKVIMEESERLLIHHLESKTLKDFV